MFYTRRTFETLTALAVLIGIFTGGMFYAVARAFIGSVAVYLAVVTGFGCALIYALLAGDALLRDMSANAPRRVDRDVDTPHRVYEKIETRLELWDTKFDAKIIGLPAPLIKVSQWLHGVYATPGYSTAFSLWAGPGKLFGEREYRKVIAELMRRGLMRWKDPTNHLVGSEWTPEGRVMLRTYALTTAPTENVDDI